jgi:NhaP-type Na+/H+ or K+/H+ antiporter
MHPEFSANPAVTVALALAAGIVAQSLARHLRVPGIVLLLAAGFLLGPDAVGVVRPELLGHALEILTGFAVAVILFEGGLNLTWRRIRRQAVVIQKLLSIGVLITAVGGTMAARLAMQWDWRPAILFGTLVIVTGPTVITPLLRRIKVRRELETILETEGVLVDAVGAMVAVVALEVLLSPSGGAVAHGFVSLPARLLAGVLFGMVGGGLLALLLRLPRVVPDGLENILSLSFALAIFQLSNALVPESGIVSVIVAGMVLGNVRTRNVRELREFKEQLTVLLIGMLFVLLAADVRLREILDLGWRGLAVVLALMLLVRPLTVLVCTAGNGFPWRHRVFLGWVAPRGIVAAAVSSLFADRLADAGVGGGSELRALVFLVIAATVIFQGATAQLFARLLGLRRPSDEGFAILSAGPIGRLLADLLRNAGHKVVLIAVDTLDYRVAEEEGCRVIYGQALNERVFLGAGMESRRGAVALLGNGAMNLLFARKARHEYKVPEVWVAIQREQSAIDPDLVHEAGGRVLFAEARDLELWSSRLRRGLVEIEQWEWTGEPAVGKEKEDDRIRLTREVRSGLLPVVLYRGNRILLCDDLTRLRAGDHLSWLVLKNRREDLQTWLRENGWRPASTQPIAGKVD